MCCDDCARLVKAHYGDTIYGADGKVLRATYFIVRHAQAGNVQDPEAV